jgi:hypothetical protein
MLVKTTTLLALRNDHLIDPESRQLRKILARDAFGDVKIWSSFDIAEAQSAEMTADTSLPERFDLIVLADPKALSAQLEAEPVLDSGHFEAPIAITLARGLNWVYQRQKQKQPESGLILDHLHWMSERASRCLRYDRYHFSVLSIEDLLDTIDRAMDSRDWLTFVLSVGQLYEQDQMRFNPYSSFDGSP